MQLQGKLRYSIPWIEKIELKPCVHGAGVMDGWCASCRPCVSRKIWEKMDCTEADAAADQMEEGIQSCAFLIIMTLWRRLHWCHNEMSHIFMIVIDGVNDILRLKYATLRDPSACNSQVESRHNQDDALLYGCVQRCAETQSHMMMGLICPA